ncbi:MAG: TIGR00730 family Rossman fold protein [Patescibacteria group bacterium]|nr:TIGR00730 family Rossman fold protein [Patescibacteria group bacterium]
MQKKKKNLKAPSAKERLKEWMCESGSERVPFEERQFTQNFNWRIFRIMAEFIEGFEFLTGLKKEVTIFGSARCGSNTKYYKEARNLGRLLGKGGYSVITGGGPGVMEAANRGATESGGESVGLNIELPKGQRMNKYVSKSIGFHYFFTRKVMLSASAQAYVFFPGGFGTLDEMLEMTVLIQTGKIKERIPVILVGKEYWQPFLDWVNKALVAEHKFVNKDEATIMQLVDSAEEAFKIIKKTAERRFG